ncbi:MAG: F0F1 ATP synthase subunit alpha [Firmicutes bacterium]|nr:F0F1 ATP synthase subunit alpha [Bacillota bacterium]
MSTMIGPEEITRILMREISNYTAVTEESNFGTVIQIGDNIAQVYGLSDACAGELLEFESGVNGIVMNLEEYTISCVILGTEIGIKEGQKVHRTGRIIEVPVGKELLGRVVNSLGDPLDGKGPVNTTKRRPIECTAPNVIERQPVNRPLYTGIKAIDSLIPIGRGQREMIIGDRQTGKTAIAIDAIINQIPDDVYCIYVAVGQKASSIASTIEIFKKHDRLKNTIIVAASANDPASMLYIAPYAGCAMAEEFMYNGKDALIVYDDLSKHANAYRELSLLLRRPPGREAYPGDVFYLHSRLLERSAQLSKELGGGSSTALPIIETQMGDVSAYIPTNVISITDGQIYLDQEIFHQGNRPAVDVGLSVSRVGGSAQISAMKKVAGHLRLDLAQYRELAAFMQFSSEELDKGSQLQILRGQRITEALKQKQFSPQTPASQIAILYLVAQGHLNSLPVEKVLSIEEAFHGFLKSKYPQFEKEIVQTGKFSDSLEKLLIEAIEKFKELYASSEFETGTEGEKSEESFEKKLWKTIDTEGAEAEKLEGTMESDLYQIKKEILEDTESNNH